MVATWKLCGVHVVTMLCPHGVHVVPMQKQCGFHMVSTWNPCGVHGYHVDNMWFPGGHHMVSMWIPSGFQMETRSRLDLLLEYPLDRYKCLADFHHFHVSSVGIRSQKNCQSLKACIFLNNSPIVNPQKVLESSWSPLYSYIFHIVSLKRETTASFSFQPNLTAKSGDHPKSTDQEP